MSRSTWYSILKESERNGTLPDFRHVVFCAGSLPLRRVCCSSLINHLAMSKLLRNLKNYFKITPVSSAGHTVRQCAFYQEHCAINYHLRTSLNNCLWQSWYWSYVSVISPKLPAVMVIKFSSWLSQVIAKDEFTGELTEN